MKKEPTHYNHGKMHQHNDVSIRIVDTPYTSMPLFVKEGVKILFAVTTTWVNPVSARFLHGILEKYLLVT